MHSRQVQLADLLFAKLRQSAVTLGEVGDDFELAA